MSLSDHILSYLSPMSMERQILLSKQALSKSYFGQKGLIEPIEVDGKLQFRSTYIDSTRLKQGKSTRMVTGSLDDAMSYLSGLGITELADIRPGLVGPAEYRDYAQVLKDINESMELTGDQQYRAQIAIHKSEVGSSSIKKFLEKMTGANAGLVFPDEDGGMALTFIQGDRVLTTEETLEVMSKSGKPLFTPGELDEALKDGNKGLSKLFAKLPKRARGILSPRDISLSADLMQSFLGPKIPLNTTGVGSEQIMKQLSEATLQIDNVFETIALAHGKDTSFGKSVKQQDVAEYIKESFQYEGGGSVEQEAKGFVDEVLDEIIASKNLGSKSDEIKKTLSNLVSEAIQTGDIDAAEGRSGIEQIKNLLKVEGAYDDKTKEVLTDLFKELEKGRDGSFLVNVKYAERSRKALKQELLDLTQNMDETSMVRKAELRGQLAQFKIGANGEAIGMSQVTVRGSVRLGKIDYSYKGAGAFQKFAGRFDKYAVITTLSGLKKETGIAAGTPILNFSGLAEYNNRVYTDTGLVAFHDALFGSPEDVAASQAHSRNVLKEFQETLSRGYLTQDSKVLQAIKKGAEQPMDEFMEHQQFSKMMSRDFQQRILDLHNSGVTINDSPEYMNLLAKWYQSELYKTKNGRKLPVAGDVYRFGLNSEANAMGATTGRRILLGVPIKEVIGAGADEFSADIAKFRVSNNTILFNERDIRKFYHALGGFDLDDHGLPILGTYTSGGQRKLGAAMVRQPTAMGEVIGLTRFEDIESYREIFGKNRFFMKTLDEMAKEDSKFLELKMAFDGSGDSDDVINQSTMGRLEQLTIEVNDRLMGATFDDKGIRTGGMRDFNRNFFEKLGVLESGKNKIENFSATKLIALGSDDPALMSIGFKRLMAEVDPMQLEEGILENVDSMISPRQKAELSQITEQLKTQRKNRLNLGGADLDFADKEIQKLSKKFYDTVDILGLSPEQKSAAYGKLFMQKSIKAAVDNTNSLGRYSNMSTVVGHGLRQMENLLGKDPLIAKDLLDQGLMLGFLPAESVIDSTQTITSNRMLMQFTAGLGNVEHEKANAVLKALYGEDVDTAKLEEKTMAQHGEQYGYLRQKYKLDGMDPRKALIVDEAFLGKGGKMTDSNLISFAENLSKGMIRADADADVADIDKAVGSQQPRQVEEVLRARGIIAKGSVSEMMDIAATSDYFLQAQKRLGTNAQISREQELASRITNQSRIASEKILDENASLIKSIQQLGELKLEGYQSEALKVDLEIRRMELGDSLLAGVQDVQRSMGISGHELVSAIQYSGIKRKIAPEFFTKLPDSSTKPDRTSANLLQRYMKISDQKASYEKQTRNLELRQYIDNLFTNMSDTQKISAVTPGLDLDFAADFFGTNNTSSVISSIIKDQTDRESGTLEEQRIGRALKAKISFEDAARLDGEASGFLNGDLASGNILRSVDDITDQTPSIVAETLRDLAGDGQSSSTATAYKRMSKAYLAEQFGKSNVRSIAIGAGLTIAASFIYQRKKDHTQQDISGPPLLPGGSAYESDYPKRSPEIPQVRGQGYTAGMNYRVSLLGDKSQVERFSAAASGLTNGNINSTMYNRIPDMARDPYQSMARSY